MRRMTWVLAALMILALPLAGAAQTGTSRVTGVVTDATGAVMPGVTVTLKAANGSTKTEVTDGTGKYTFTGIAAGSYDLTAELSGFNKQTVKVDVTADQVATMDLKLSLAAQQETVQVTGSLIPRPTLEAMSPVTTLEIEELTYRGINRVEDMLTALPQVFAAQNSTVSNGSTGTATVDLRYLGPNRTLVLLDGRRLPSGDAFALAPDLNFIPSALVKRVDVLTGGASSVYGADAVAGVVNFVLDRNFQGASGGFQVGGYQHNNSNALAQRINQAKGFAFPSGNIWNGAPSDFNIALGSKFGEGNMGHAAFYLDYRTTPAITKDQRDYTNCSVLSGMTMNGPTCGGSGTWPAGWFSVLSADQSSVANYVLDTSGAGNTLRPRTSRDVFNYAPYNFMQRNDTRWAGGAFMNYAWNKFFNAYGEVQFMDDRSDAQIAPSGDFGNSTQINCNNPLLSAQERQLLCTDMGYGPNDIATVSIYKRNVEGGGRISHLQHTAIRFSAGMKGDLSKAWSYDVYALSANVHSPNSYANDLNASRIQEALLVDPTTGGCTSGNPLCVPYNVFRVGGVTNAALDYLRLPLVYNSGTQTRLVNGKMSVDLKQYGVALPWASEGIKAAFGGEYRDEYIFVDPDLAFREALGAGQGGPTLPVDGSYHVKEFFSEGLIPVVQNAPYAKDLSLELGYRLSDYSSTGRWPTYKFQASWAPTPDIKVRAGYNKATRSPNVIELYSAQGLGLGGSIDPCAGATPSASQAACAKMGVTAARYGLVLANPASQYNTLGGGNPDLKPEIASTWTGGLVLTPKFVPGFTAAFDYYRIKINDTIGSLAADDILRQCAATGNPVLCSLVHRDQFGSIWQTTNGYTLTANANVGKLNTEGLDMNFSYTKALGKFGSASANLIGTYLMHQGIDTGLYAYDCVGFFGNQCGIPTPRWRHLARFTWETPFKTSINFGWRLIGHATADIGSTNEALADPASIPLYKANNIYEIPTTSYFDIGATYKLMKGYTLVGGINNIFDKEPPLAPGMSPNDYGPGFYGTYDPLGRYLHFSLQFKF